MVSGGVGVHTTGKQQEQPESLDSISLALGLTNKLEDTLHHPWNLVRLGGVWSDWKTVELTVAFGRRWGTSGYVASPEQRR